MGSIRKDIKMHALNPSVFSSQLSIYLASKPKLLKWHSCVRLDPEGEHRSGREQSRLEGRSDGKEAQEPVRF